MYGYSYIQQQCSTSNFFSRTAVHAPDYGTLKTIRRRRRMPGRGQRTPTAAATICPGTAAASAASAAAAATAMTQAAQRTTVTTPAVPTWRTTIAAVAVAETRAPTMGGSARPSAVTMAGALVVGASAETATAPTTTTTGRVAATTAVVTGRHRAREHGVCAPLCRHLGWRSWRRLHPPAG